MLALLARKSLQQRRLTTGLTILSIALSVCLLLGVDLIRLGARESFTGAISGTDLVVGPRSSPTTLVLYSVFGIGSGSGGVSVESWDRLAAHPAVEWTAPLAFGDSYRGYRVVGTTESFFARFRFYGGRELAFAAGGTPVEDHDATLGAAVAADLGLELGDELVIAHGVQEHALMEHSEHPFRVAGILARTNTPVDRSVYVTLEGMEAMHEEEEDEDGEPDAHGEEEAEHDAHGHEEERGGLEQISAVLVGLRSRPDVLRLKREIDEEEAEPLTAAMPAVALNELWTTLGYAEQALRAISIAVVCVGLISMLIALYSTLQERRREIAVLRAVGLGRREVLSLLVIEAGLLAAAGAVLGVVLVYTALFLLQPALEAGIGFHLPIRPPTALHLSWLAGLIGAGMVIGLIPAWRAYRNSLADGLAVRL